MPEFKTRVLITGAGPVGLSTAFFLACQGIRPVVIEKRAATSVYPRASTSMRTLEIFRSFGLAPQLGRLGWVNYGPSRAVYMDCAVGTTFAESEAPPSHTRRLEECSPAESRMVPQNLLEVVLLREVRRRGGEVRFDTRLTGFEQNGSGVRATLADTRSGASSEVRAEYLVAADGANSDVRDMLGIGMPDREVAGHLTTAFHQTDLGPIMHKWRAHLCLVRNDEVYSTLYSFDGRDKWSTHFLGYPGKPDGPAELGADLIAKLLRATIGDDTVTSNVISANPWVAQIGIASSFRRGRVFLAGDSAHVQTSAGGLGMNTGIQDGHNLAWKLAAVLQGQADAKLLDTYEPERQAAALDSLRLSRNQFRAFVGDSESAESVHESTSTDYLRGLMFYRYQSAAILGENNGDGELGVLDDDARPGYRLPHCWLSENGDTLSTVDVSGGGWLLLARSDGHDWLSAAVDAGRTWGIDLRAHRVTPDGRDGALGDRDGKFAEVAGFGPEGAVLVRPDGFVAWRSTGAVSDPSRRLTEAVGRVLGRV
ncbi:FAD-dependent monooxygenase [Amycolatopsis anabasis]|uniref:FAD-dependent monooxygenase n=1 Tax=Amycolatopsis anabasis TaxID=1840409 RepID=UPI00131AD33E|nr:FAD-dependent monooxygenase [Amycolatopsis anabasis]